MTSGSKVYKSSTCKPVTPTSFKRVVNTAGSLSVAEHPKSSESVHQSSQLSKRNRTHDSIKDHPASSSAILSVSTTVKTVVCPTI